MARGRRTYGVDVSPLAAFVTAHRTWRPERVEETLEVMRSAAAAAREGLGDAADALDAEFTGAKRAAAEAAAAAAGAGDENDDGEKKADGGGKEGEGKEGAAAAAADASHDGRSKNGGGDPRGGGAGGGAGAVPRDW
jgi:hypothetical protein